MLSKNALQREIDNLSEIIVEIELAITMEKGQASEAKLVSAKGQLKMARASLIKVLKDFENGSKKS